MGKLSDIKSSTYASNAQAWDEYRQMVYTPEEIIAALPPVAEEIRENLEARRQLSVDRANLAQAVQSQCDILAMAGIDYRIDGVEWGEEPIDDQGRDIAAFVTGPALFAALTFGEAFIVVDRPDLDLDGVTVADAEQAPPPYAYVLSPLAVPAVAYADDGTILAAIVKGSKSVPGEYGFDTQVIKTWTLWTRTEIRVEDVDGKVLLEKINPLGVVPISRWKINQSFVKGLFSAVKSCDQHYSIACTGGLHQLYGLSIIYSDADISQVEVGSGKGLKLNQGDRYENVSSDPGGLTFNLQISLGLEQHIRGQLHQRVIEGANALAKVSGESKRQDRIPQENFSQYLGQRCADAIRMTADLLGYYYGMDEVETIVQLPSVYVIGDPAEDRAQAQYLSGQYQEQTELQYVAKTKLLRRLSGVEAEMAEDEITNDDKAISEKAGTLFAPMAIDQNLLEGSGGAGTGEQVGGEDENQRQE